VSGNLIHDQVGKGHVVYTDNGCTFESILGNGIYNTGPANAWGSTHHNYLPGATTTNDPTDVKNNFWMNGAANGTNSGVTVSGNTAITSASQIPASIVDSAGLEPAFQGLLNWTQAPLPPVGNGFSLSVSPGSQTVVQGATATYTVHTVAGSGSSSPITLSANVPPPTGATVSFSPNPVAPGGDSTMTVTTGAASPPGSYPITVSGNDSAVTRTAGVTLVVQSSGGGGLTISALSVKDTANAANWSLQADLQVGNTLYGDRVYTVSALPATLVGAQWIRTANSSKTATPDPLVTFSVNQAATVYVGIDTRTPKRPWMDASWVDTGTTLTTNENGTTRTYAVFSKGFAAGQVALGPNAANTNMYTIAVL